MRKPVAHDTNETGEKFWTLINDLYELLLVERVLQKVPSHQGQTSVCDCFSVIENYSMVDCTAVQAFMPESMESKHKI